MLGPVLYSMHMSSALGKEVAEKLSNLIAVLWGSETSADVGAVGSVAGLDLGSGVVGVSSTVASPKA